MYNNNSSYPNSYPIVQGRTILLCRIEGTHPVLHLLQCSKCKWSRAFFHRQFLVMMRIAISLLLFNAQNKTLNVNMRIYTACYGGDS
jgi:hypothetical protein